MGLEDLGLDLILGETAAYTGLEDVVDVLLVEWSLFVSSWTGRCAASLSRAGAGLVCAM